MAEKNQNTTNSPETKKVENKPTKVKDKKPGIFARLGKFIKDTKGELKKVVWTSKSDVWKSFKLVIASVVAISLIILAIDMVSNEIIGALANNIG